MGSRTFRRLLQVATVTLTLVSAVTVSAATPPATPAPSQIGTLPRSFAVFVVSYNTANDEAVGGVAGTAFFISEKQAVTANHVLQAKSFEPAPGFERARVWLVHENESPIEIKPENVQSIPGQDRATIRIGEKVPRKFIYGLRTQPLAGGEVSTEGFRANTGGPVLARVGKDIQIMTVPRLERLNPHGRLLKKANVDLAAADVRLKSIPCLQVSYVPVRGLSGGPVLVDGKVIGVNSFADPTGVERTWAVEMGER